LLADILPTDILPTDILPADIWAIDIWPADIWPADIWPMIYLVGTVDIWSTKSLSSELLKSLSAKWFSVKRRGANQNVNFLLTQKINLKLEKERTKD
jgi:hypothetical protein